MTLMQKETAVKKNLSCLKKGCTHFQTDFDILKKSN